jgi:hypothetical protein
MCKLCQLTQKTKNWMAKKPFERSKIYSKFHEFVRKECDDNLEGFLIGILFHSRNTTISWIRDAVRNHLTEG